MAILAFVVLSLAIVTLAPAHRGLPAGNLIVSYATHCNESTIMREVEAGVNVLVWFAIHLGTPQVLAADGSSWVPEPAGAVPEILGGPEKHCVASVRKLLDEAGFVDVAHMISIGGWDAPHPNTALGTGAEWWTVFEAWNVDPTDAHRPLYDGIDWDLEGNDQVTNPANTFTYKCLRLMHDMSTSAKTAGALVSLVPPQSYLDVSSSQFDRKLLHAYPDYHADQAIHGMNAYAPLLAWGPQLYDFVDIQLYETHSRAAQAVLDSNMTADEYLIQLTQSLTSGNWTVDFSADPLIGVGKVPLTVSPSKLIFGFSRTEPLLFHPDDVAKAFASFNESDRPRGVMFWNMDEDDKPCTQSTAEAVEVCHDFATEFNKFLQVRQSNVEPDDSLLQGRSSDATSRDAKVKRHVQLSAHANMKVSPKPNGQRPTKSLMREEYSEP